MLTIPKKNMILIIDRSGSIESIKREIYGGFNEHVQVARRDVDAGNRVAIWETIFSDSVVSLASNTDPRSVPFLTDETFKPYGWTRLQDAIGDTILQVQEETKDEKDSQYLVVILTDGKENRSETFVGHEGLQRLRTMIDACKETGRWTFSFIGVPGLEGFASNLGVPVSNQMYFLATAGGTARALKSATSSAEMYMANVSASCLAGTPINTANYFNSADRPVDLTTDMSSGVKWTTSPPSSAAKP